MRAFVALALALAGLLGGCAVTPTYVYDLMDAEDDSDVAAAVKEACFLLGHRRKHLAVRQAAARTLGRLRSDDMAVVEALQRALQPRERPALRRQAAWALGELRSFPALHALTQALRSDMDDETGAYVLEAVAKHYAVMARDEDTLVTVVEAMVFFAGNRKHDVPAVYDLLGARSRTIGVNVRVLENATRRYRSEPSDQTRAAVYNATLELLAKVAADREEILAGPAVWAPRVEAAVDGARHALEADPEHTAMLVLWQLGLLAKDAELGAPAARALVGDDVPPRKRPTRAKRAALRLVASWALARMQVHALGPRQALLQDVVSKERDPKVLRAFGDLSKAPNTKDALQLVMPEVGGAR